MPSDVDFLYGSGFFPLRAGETKRISLAVVFGESPVDLYSNLATVRTIYNENYNFIQPPAKPVVNAVAADKSVTLYWDDAAEKSIDRISGLRDFQGYRIYRATDAGFLDNYSITDGQGTTSGFRPTAQFDLIDEIEVTSTCPERHPVLLVRIRALCTPDTTVVNGQAYFYAVTLRLRRPDGRVSPAGCAKQASIDGLAGCAGRGLRHMSFRANRLRIHAPLVLGGRARHRHTGNLLLQIIDEQQLVDDAV